MRGVSTQGKARAREQACPDVEAAGVAAGDEGGKPRGWESEPKTTGMLSAGWRIQTFTCYSRLLHNAKHRGLEEKCHWEVICVFTFVDC